MMQIKRETYNGAGTPKITITCPQCLKKTSFCNYIIRKCDDCGFKWGNIYLLGDIKVRVRYFTDGEI